MSRAIRVHSAFVMGRRKGSRSRAVETRAARSVDGPRRRVLTRLWPYPVLALVCLVAYAPALHGEFLWDDNLWVSGNPHLDDLTGLARIWTDPGVVGQYYPITVTTFWIEKHLWGLDTLGYHVVNVLLHALGAFLVLRILQHLQIRGAWIAAAVFALHPIQVESVAWIAERKNTLSGVFYLGAALAYLRAARATGSAERPRLHTGLAVAAVALFVAALLSKSVTASLPVILALVLFWKEGRIGRSHLPWLGGMLVVGAAYGVLTATLEVREVGARGAEFALSLVERTLLAGRIFWFYLGKLVWPHPLSFMYERWSVDSGVWWWWVFAPAAAALVAALWLLRSRIGRGPLVAILLFGITVSPALGFLNVFPMRYSWVADHFQYLAGLGPMVLLAAAWDRLRDRAPMRGVWTVATAVILVVLAGATWRQAHDYRDLETLWRATIEKSPGAWVPPYNLGKMLAMSGREDEALDLLERAVAIKPDNVEAYTEIGNILLARGETDRAVASYEKAVTTDPTYAIGYLNLGIALEAAGRAERAEAAYRNAVQHAWTLEGRYRYRRGPLPWRGHLNLARLLERQGRLDEAIVEYDRAYDTNPDVPDALVDLGNLFAEAGRVDEAIAAFRRALEVEPRSAATHYNLGLQLERMGEDAGALREYRAAVSADPSLAPAWNNLAIAFYRTGAYADAWEAARRSARLGLEPHPEFLEALSARMPEPRR